MIENKMKMPGREGGSMPPWGIFAGVLLQISGLINTYPDQFTIPPLDTANLLSPPP